MQYSPEDADKIEPYIIWMFRKNGYHIEMLSDGKYVCKKDDGTVMIYPNQEEFHKAMDKTE